VRIGGSPSRDAAVPRSGDFAAAAPWCPESAISPDPGPSRGRGPPAPPAPRQPPPSPTSTRPR